jgi:hypothetical protein
LSLAEGIAESEIFIVARQLLTGVSLGDP